MTRAASWLICMLAALVAGSGCYEHHRAPGEQDLLDPTPPAAQAGGPGIRVRERMPLPERPRHQRPTLPPVACTAQPAPDCVSSFPRIMIVMDASSSMLAGRSEGNNNWDKARFALAGNPKADDAADPGFVLPAFARELDVRGNLVTMEDVFHLGLIVFNTETTQRLVLQYAPCATDNIAWAMDPYVSCERPDCIDPYAGEPGWTYKNSNFDRSPPFVQTTLSYVPPCNSGGRIACVGNTFNTYTGEGLQFAADNIDAYRRSPGGFELSPSTRFANILITDGATSPGSMPEGVLASMAAQGIPTYVIGLEPQGTDTDLEEALEQLDRYAAEGGTELATLVPADGRNIADAFAEAVTRVIDDIGTDPCCQPNRCRENPEPRSPGLGVL
jgi:hypothetical protein